MHSRSGWKREGCAEVEIRSEVWRKGAGGEIERKKGEEEKKG